MKRIKQKLKELIARVCALENAILSKKEEQSEEKPSDTPSYKEVIDEWLSGKSK